VRERERAGVELTIVGLIAWRRDGGRVVVVSFSVGTAIITS
jgi:hypothetical protein